MPEAFETQGNNQSATAAPAALGKISFGAPGAPAAGGNEAPSSSPRGRVPKKHYTCRFMSGAITTSGAGYKQFALGGEIVSPDIVDDPGNAGRKLSVAGRRFNVYLHIDSAAPKFPETRDVLRKLNLIDAAGECDPNVVLAKASSGQLFFGALLDSKEKIAVEPLPPGSPKGTKPKEILGFDGKPVKSGWEINYVGADDITGLAPAVPGLAAPSGTASSNRPF